MPYGNCYNCEYWFLYRSNDPYKRSQLRAHCRRHAPTIIADDDQLLTLFPSPRAHLGCGEWEKRDEHRDDDTDELTP